MRNYNNDNIVKFLFKFLSIFHTSERTDYYNAVLDRQLLQHMCQALHILVSRTNQVLHFLTSTHWRVSKLLPKKPKQNDVLCNNNRHWRQKRKPPPYLGANSLFYPEVGGIRFLLNFLSFLPDYTEPHPKPQKYSRIIILNKINLHALKSPQSESTHLDDSAIKDTVHLSPPIHSLSLGRVMQLSL